MSAQKIVTEKCTSKGGDIGETEEGNANDMGQSCEVPERNRDSGPQEDGEIGTRLVAYGEVAQALQQHEGGGRRNAKAKAEGGSEVGGTQG